MNHEYDFSEILIGEDFAMYLKCFVQNEKITAKMWNGSHYVVKFCRKQNCLSLAIW